MNFVCGSKEGIGELFAFAKGGLDYRKILDVSLPMALLLGRNLTIRHDGHEAR